MADSQDIRKAYGDVLVRGHQAFVSSENFGDDDEEEEAQRGKLTTAPSI